jgi:hypothetical protein
MKLDTESAWKKVGRASRSAAALMLLAILGMGSRMVWAGVNVGTSIGPDGGEIQALAVDPQNSNTVYAATSYGLFKSMDGGSSWRNLFLSSSANVFSITVNPQDPSTIYAGTDNGVAKSTDGGESWTPIPCGPDRIRLLALDPQNPTTLYAGGPDGLFAITFVP